MCAMLMLTAIWNLNGVWLMAIVSAVASGILTLLLAKTLSISDTHIIEKQ